MNSRVAFYLRTDPFFENLEKALRGKGIGLSPISTDEFEETVATGHYKVYRDMETVLLSRFMVAIDWKHRVGLVTCKVPEGYDPPLTSEQAQLQDLMRKH